MSDQHSPQDRPDTAPTPAPIPAPVTAPITTRATAPDPVPVAPAAQVATPAAPPAPEVTYLPPPSGPNWGLVLLGLLFVLVAGGVAANQVAGFQVVDVMVLAPTALIFVGLGCALVGIVGILARRR
jgi:hypothetical protein